MCTYLTEDIAASTYTHTHTHTHTQTHTLISILIYIHMYCTCLAEDIAIREAEMVASLSMERKANADLQDTLNRLKAEHDKCPDLIAGSCCMCCLSGLAYT